jgi:ubiquinone/menaquinone biosynthesis C-methylase UbiE
MGGDLAKGRSTDAETRKRYLEGKLRSEARRPDKAASECERHLRYLHRLGAAESGVRVLDLGCGTGRWTVEIAERGYDTYAIDINSDFVETTRDRARKKNVSAHCAVARAEMLPFSDGFFDIAIANNVLEHVADWKKTLDEIARVTKPGGMAYFDTVNALYPLPTEVKYIPFFSYIPGRIKQWLMDIIVERYPSLVSYSSTPARNWFTPTGLRKALSGVGFNNSWDLIDVITKEEVPVKYRFASRLLPLLKKIPRLYARDIAHFPVAGLRLFCRKDINPT